MKSDLLKELCAASKRLQDSHDIAKRCGRADIAAEIRRTGEAISGLIGRVATNKFEAEKPAEPTFD